MQRGAKKKGWGGGKISPGEKYEFNKALRMVCHFREQHRKQQAGPISWHSKGGSSTSAECFVNFYVISVSTLIPSLIISTVPPNVDTAPARYYAEVWSQVPEIISIRFLDKAAFAIPH